MSWNEEKVEKLKELWGKGSTASQIAEIIGGISRNAVIGKAHRLNLSSKIKTRNSSSNQNFDNVSEENSSKQKTESKDSSIYTYEPDEETILKDLLPKNISQISTRNLLSMFYFPMAISFYTLVDAEGIQHANNPYQFIVWIFILTAIPMLIYSLVMNRANLILTLSKNKFKFLITGIISTTSYALVLWAYTEAPTYYVASVRESSIIFASLIGLYFFKEDGVKKRLIAALILFIGIFVLQIYSF